MTEEEQADAEFNLVDNAELAIREYYNGDRTQALDWLRKASAATDMLEALKSSLGAIWELRIGDWTSADFERDPTVIAIRAAIAKATGEP